MDKKKLLTRIYRAALRRIELDEGMYLDTFKVLGVTAEQYAGCWNAAAQDWLENQEGKHESS